MKGRPESSEAAPYYFTYIDRISDGDIVGALDYQSKEMLRLLHRAFRLVSRKKSKALPWKLFEPDFTTAFRTAPEFLPYSGLSVFVTSRNSAMASGLGTISGVLSGRSFESVPLTR